MYKFIRMKIEVLNLNLNGIFLSSEFWEKKKKRMGGKIIAEVVKRSKNIVEDDLKCFVKDVFVQTDDLWILRNDSELFKLESYNYTYYLIVCTWYYYIHLFNIC